MKTLSDISLSHGAHTSPDAGMCAMEAVAWYMDETHSDHPKCVSPVIAAAMRAMNDRLPDSDRDTVLKPLLLEVIGTNTGLEDDIKRAQIAAEYARKFADLVPGNAYAEARASAARARASASWAAKAANWVAYAAESAASAAYAAAEAAPEIKQAAYILFGEMILDMCKVGK